MPSPLIHDFTDAEVAIAKAGYAAYQANQPGPIRPSRPWCELRKSERFRWCMVAMTIADGDVPASEARAVYYTGWRDREIPWEDVKPAFKRQWVEVHRAMTEAAMKAGIRIRKPQRRTTRAIRVGAR